MANLISFKTSRFDISAETPNPINPIAGQGVLAWLRPQLAEAGYQSTDPDSEDWGWYMDVQGAGGSYLVGASGDADSEERDVEWVVQVHRHRSLTDKMFGRNVMANDDPLVSTIEGFVRADRQLRDVSVERDA
jgi:hypothetical protein